MLEKMSSFFEKRVDGYDEHMLNCIESAQEFYPYTAACLPQSECAAILDLGCGTGLELQYYFQLNPAARVTGIDLTKAMIDELRRKLPDKDITLIIGSYFDVPFEEHAFDAAVSVESLHHFTKEEKVPLYKNIHKALKSGGYFILTDYFVASVEEERFYRNELLRLKKLQGIDDNEFYHYDTPLTVEHETQVLFEAGFASVEILCSWGNTYSLKASK